MHRQRPIGVAARTIGRLRTLVVEAGEDYYLARAGSPRRRLNLRDQCAGHAMAGVVERDANGFIIAGPDLVRDGRRPRGFEHDPFLLETSVPGIFVAGDVRSSSVKRVASSVGEGSIAIQFVHRYLATL